MRKADKLRKLARKAAISRRDNANKREADFRQRERLPTALQRKVDRQLGKNVMNALGVVQLPGYGTGSFKRDETMNDGQVRRYRKIIAKRVDKRR